MMKKLMKKITEILILLELDNIIDRSDSGLDMILGENGVKLSGGQKQKNWLSQGFCIQIQVF